MISGMAAVAAAEAARLERRAEVLEGGKEEADVEDVVALIVLDVVLVVELLPTVLGALSLAPELNVSARPRRARKDISSAS